ncbi:MAG: hypothetical protein ACHP7P_12290 [Terriglobales bacterium]
MRVVIAVAVAMLFSSRLAAKDEKGFVMPKPADAKTYPAHDASEKEKVAVAADPYDLPDKTQGVFRIKYKDEDLLPVLLIITNDGGQPVALTGMQVELVTRKREKIQPATEEDIYRRIARQPMKGDQPSANPLPFPRKIKTSVKKEEQQEIQDSRFAVQAVEPHATRGGFLFFDVEGIDDPLAGAHLYVSGLRNGQGQELIFFDIPLEKYLEHAPVK